MWVLAMLLDLTQPITYWTPASVDGNGDKTFSTGEMVLARWIRMDGLVTNSNGDDQKTEYIVYADQALPKRAIVALEDLEGETSPPDGARQVMEISENPSMTDFVKHKM